MNDSSLSHRINPLICSYNRTRSGTRFRALRSPLTPVFAMLSAAVESIRPFRRIPGGIRDVVRRCIFTRSQVSRYRLMFRLLLNVPSPSACSHRAQHSPSPLCPIYVCPALLFGCTSIPRPLGGDRSMPPTPSCRLLSLNYGLRRLAGLRANLPGCFAVTSSSSSPKISAMLSTAGSLNASIGSS